MQPSSGSRFPELDKLIVDVLNLHALLVVDILDLERHLSPGLLNLLIQFDGLSLEVVPVLGFFSPERFHTASLCLRCGELFSEYVSLGNSPKNMIAVQVRLSFEVLDDLLNREAQESSSKIV